jgi:hypothetical protein
MFLRFPIKCPLSFYSFPLPTIPPSLSSSPRLASSSFNLIFLKHTIPRLLFSAFLLIQVSYTWPQRISTDLSGQSRPRVLGEVTHSRPTHTPPKVSPWNCHTRTPTDEMPSTANTSGDATGYQSVNGATGNSTSTFTRSPFSSEMPFLYLFHLCRKILVFMS